MSENEEYNECDCYPEIHCCSCVRLGDKAPNFEAITTRGKIEFSEFNKGSWVVLFSHPADFTPVCTTEFSAFAMKQDEFAKRNVKLLGLSIDSVYSHIAWVKDIENTFEVKINFPVIADLSAEVASLYNMIHPPVSDVHAIRCVYIIDPKGVIRFVVNYPLGVGRNIGEIIRTIDAIQLVDKEGIATPANWDIGEEVIIPPPLTMQESEQREHEKHDTCHNWYLCKKKL